MSLSSQDAREQRGQSSSRRARPAALRTHLTSPQPQSAVSIEFLPHQRRLLVLAPPLQQLLCPGTLGPRRLKSCCKASSPRAAVPVHSHPLHSSGKLSVLFNQSCLQGSTALEHQSNKHIQQTVCPAVQSCWLQMRGQTPKLRSCSGRTTVIPASFSCLLPAC